MAMLIFLGCCRWRDLGDPKLGVLSLDVVDHQSSDEYNGRGQQKHGKEVPSQRPDMRVDARKQCCCSSGRVGALGEVHDDQSNGCSQTGCEPLESRFRVVLEIELEDGGDNHSDKSAEEVAENERPRLSQRYIYGSIAQYC
jgi:hypothetical protein